MHNIYWWVNTINIPSLPQSSLSSSHKPPLSPTDLSAVTHLPNRALPLPLYLSPASTLVLHLPPPKSGQIYADRVQIQPEPRHPWAIAMTGGNVDVWMKAVMATTMTTAMETTTTEAMVATQAGTTGSSCAGATGACVGRSSMSRVQRRFDEKRAAHNLMVRSMAGLPLCRLLPFLCSPPLGFGRICVDNSQIRLDLGHHNGGSSMASARAGGTTRNAMDNMRWQWWTTARLVGKVAQFKT